MICEMKVLKENDSPGHYPCRSADNSTSTFNLRHENDPVIAPFIGPFERGGYQKLLPLGHDRQNGVRFFLLFIVFHPPR